MRAQQFAPALAVSSATLGRVQGGSWPWREFCPIPSSDPWHGQHAWERTPRCSCTPNSEILMDCLTFTKKRAGNTVLLLNYGLLGLFLNVINGTSVLRARDIHQQSHVPLAQVGREFQDVPTPGSAVPTRG